MTRDDVVLTLQTIAGKILNRSAEQCPPDGDLKNVLGGDDLDRLEITMAVEERFGLELDDECLEWATLGEPHRHAVASAGEGAGSVKTLAEKVYTPRRGYPMHAAPRDGREIIAIWRDIANGETPVFVFYCPSNKRFIGRHGDLHGGHGYVEWLASPRLIYHTPDRKPWPTQEQKAGNSK